MNCNKLGSNLVLIVPPSLSLSLSEGSFLEIILFSDGITSRNNV